MSRRLIPGILTVSLVGACQVLPLTASKGESELGGSTRTTAKTTTPRASATATPSADKASDAAAKATPTPTPTPRATGTADPTASGATSVGSGPTTLSLVSSPTGFKLIPVRDDQGGLVKLMYGGGNSKMSWQLTASAGPQAFSFDTWSIELKQEEAYASLYPEEPASGEAQTTGTADASADEPFSFKQTPAELTWPSQVSPNSTVSLTFDLSSSKIRPFIEAHPAMAKLRLTATAINKSGEPLKFDNGKPLALTAVVQVL